MSLMAGLVFGALSAYGALKLSNNPSDIKISLCEYSSAHSNWLQCNMGIISRCSFPLFAVASGLLSVVMGTRYKKSGKLMPAGIICGLRSELVLHVIKSVIVLGNC